MSNTCEECGYIMSVSDRFVENGVVHVELTCRSICCSHVEEAEMVETEWTDYEWLLSVRTGDSS